MIQDALGLLTFQRVFSQGRPPARSWEGGLDSHGFRSLQRSGLRILQPCDWVTVILVVTFSPILNILQQMFNTLAQRRPCVT